MANELMPCPFCDESATTQDDHDGIDGLRKGVCTKCSAEALLDDWNTRAVTARERKLVEALKKVYCDLRSELDSGGQTPTGCVPIIDAIRLVEPNYGKDAKE